MKHTPGPWSVRENKITCMTYNNSGVPKGWVEIDQMNTANAHLIAAAPELLEALETVFAVFKKRPAYGPNGLTGYEESAIAMVEDAIAKATGGA